MMSSPAPDFQGSLAELRSCIVQQMEREESTLARARSLLETIQSALASGSPENIEQLAEHDQEARQIEEGRNQRERFCSEVASRLAIPTEAVNLSNLLQRIPFEQRKELLVRQQKLQRQAEEVTRLFDSSAVLALWGLGFLHRFFLDVAGGHASECYGPWGASREAPGATLLEIQG